mgnify:CR=1 FL=1
MTVKIRTHRCAAQRTARKLFATLVRSKAWLQQVDLSLVNRDAFGTLIIATAWLGTV